MSCDPLYLFYNHLMPLLKYMASSGNVLRGCRTCKIYTLSVVVPMGWVGDLLKKDLVPMGTKSLFWQVLGVKFHHKLHF